MHCFASKDDDDSSETSQCDRDLRNNTKRFARFQCLNCYSCFSRKRTFQTKFAILIKLTRPFGLAPLATENAEKR